MSILLLAAAVAAILLQGTITTLPLVLICLLCLTIFKRDAGVFPIAFFVGFLLDVFTLHRIGGASIFFLIFVLLILLYQRKYEINSYPFVAAASFLGSWFFLLIFGEAHVFWLSLMNVFIGIVLFMLLRLVDSRKSK